MNDPFGVLRYTIGMAAPELSVQEYKAAFEALDALRRAFSEHHSVGLLDKARVGDRCPICSKLGPGFCAGTPPTDILYLVK